MQEPLPCPGPSKFRVAICGGGVGGLVLANTIGKYDSSVPIDLYEAHDSISTTGAGITLWRRTHKVMTELGILDDVKGIFTRPPESSHGTYYRRSDIRDGGYDWFHQMLRYGPSQMHRQQMVAILEKCLPASCTVHFKKRLTSFAEPPQHDGGLTEPITLSFADGTTATADILIGADGVRSAVRKTMFEAASEDGDEADLKQYIDATWTGMVVYRSLFPAENLRKVDPENPSLREMIVRAGKGKSIVTYPIANGTLIYFGAVVADPSLTEMHYEGHWVSNVTRDELLICFENFEPEVRMLLQYCENPSKWALHVVKQLPFCIQGRVALMGDASHAMAPYLGAGAGQAIEDAFVLGRLLAHPLTTLARVPDALRIYQDIRLPFGSSVASNSLSIGWMGHFMAPGYYDGTRKDEDLDDRGISAFEREEMNKLEQAILKRWEWMEKDGAIEEWQEAEQRLREEAGVHVTDKHHAE
ncbi:FAD/NAD(P)-binding domain-containing protein [Gyrodon lividus]|nr:FAD/NAD(P)-binding domain-containing protein [Gyrodon lividus]